jgi:hypothetical protein
MGMPSKFLRCTGRQNSHLWKVVIAIALDPLISFVSRPLNAEPTAPLPPNWEAGGKASIERRGGLSGPSGPRRPSSGSPETRSDVGEAEFRGERPRHKRQTLSLHGSLPEIARLDYRFALSSRFALNLGVSGPIPVTVDVSMPSDVIKADTQKGIAVAYPAFDIHFNVTWGPHMFAGVLWHPFGGSWYTTMGAGARFIQIKGQASSALRICSIIEAAKEPPCGNDGAAIQTRNEIALRADIQLLSYVGRAATGWGWELSDKMIALFEVGMMAPFNTQQKATVSAQIKAPDGTPEELSGALAELRGKSEMDLQSKAIAELAKVTNKPLPVLGIGLGYRF